MQNIAKEMVNKDVLVLEYIDDYIKMLPIRDDIIKKTCHETDVILKQEPNIYIINSNEHMEE